MTDVMTVAHEWLICGVDLLLGWLLILPRDVSLLLFAVGTALLMTLIRRLVTNQELLHRCAADQRQLKTLMRDAKAAKDKAWQDRLRTTRGQIKGVQLGADMRVLCVALIPIAILAIWASERLDYLPPRQDRDLTLRAYFPASSIDRLTFLVTDSNVVVKSPAIQLVGRSEESPPTGMAQWTVYSYNPGDFNITIRHLGESVTHPVSIGRVFSSAPVLQHSRERILRTELGLERYKPLGSHLGSPWIGLPPWMIGYLVLTLILVPVFKRLLRVA